VQVYKYVSIHLQWHGVIDHAHARFSVAQKMILTVRARMAYPLKPWLSQISMPHDACVQSELLKWIL